MHLTTKPPLSGAVAWMPIGSLWWGVEVISRLVLVAEWDQPARIRPEVGRLPRALDSCDSPQRKGLGVSQARRPSDVGEPSCIRLMSACLVLVQLWPMNRTRSSSHAAVQV
jgi:hypothetical protein